MAYTSGVGRRAGAFSGAIYMPRVTGRQDKLFLFHVGIKMKGMDRLTALKYFTAVALCQVQMKQRNPLTQFWGFPPYPCSQGFLNSHFLPVLLPGQPEQGLGIP